MSLTFKANEYIVCVTYIYVSFVFLRQYQYILSTPGSRTSVDVFVDTLVFAGPWKTWLPELSPCCGALVWAGRMP